eukprot:5327817-Prymnesium_polylepis.1
MKQSKRAPCDLEMRRSNTASGSSSVTLLSPGFSALATTASSAQTLVARQASPASRRPMSPPRSSRPPP